jgi:hypothetical protein
VNKQFGKVKRNLCLFLGSFPNVAWQKFLHRIQKFFGFGFHKVSKMPNKLNHGAERQTR